MGTARPSSWVGTSEASASGAFEMGLESWAEFRRCRWGEGCFRGGDLLEQMWRAGKAQGFWGMGEMQLVIKAVLRSENKKKAWTQNLASRIRRD